MDKTGIASLFDRIAHSYDGLNHLLSFGADRGWRRKAIRCLSPVENLLDVAIGTADLAIGIIGRNKAQTITGLDVSGKMMEIGREKVARRKMDGRISFVLGSALDMPFPYGSFDAVTCAYGLRNFPDAAKGLSEMFRVLRPGGELMILEFSYPENAFIRFFYDFYFSRILPVIGRIASGDKGAYEYLNRSVKGFVWGRELCGMIEAAGFRDVSFRTLTFGITTIYLAKKQFD